MHISNYIKITRSLCKLSNDLNEKSENIVIDSELVMVLLIAKLM